MKLPRGDIVRVRYPNDKCCEGEEFIGIIIETNVGRMSDKMWCITTGSEHILNKFRDHIEVLNR